MGLCAISAEEETEAAAGSEVVLLGDADDASLTHADISEAGLEGTQPSLVNGDVSRADDVSRAQAVSSGRMEDDAAMLERQEAEPAAEGTGVNGYMDLDGLPKQASFLASPEQHDAHRSAGSQPAVKVRLLYV